MLVFASLEAFSTRAILIKRHGGQEIGGTSWGHKRDLRIIDVWTIDSIVAGHRSEKTAIDMGKGFNRARNKQAELAKKMAAATSQNKVAAPESDTTGNLENSNKEEDKGREDFEALLRTTKGAIPSGDDTESAYIAPIEAGNKTKRKKIMPQSPKKPKKSKQNTADAEVLTEAIFEAQRRHFESLINVSTSAPLGPIGAARLVPWVPPFLKKGLIVFVDPRSNSKDLRRAIGYHASSSLMPSSSDLDIAFVTADSLGETQAWLKRNEINLVGLEEELYILCDPGWAFMETYEIVGDSIDHRWSMAMLAFNTKGDLVRLDRDVDPSSCGELVASATKYLGACNQ